MGVPLTAAQQRTWAQSLHLLILDALMKDSSWGEEELAFHGGTSLRLSWASPRFSEDLDFLLARPAARQLDQVMRRVHRRVQDTLAVQDPSLILELKARTGRREKLRDYLFRLKQPEVYGKATVKVEFWEVAPGYLEAYETTFRGPLIDGEIIGRVSPDPIPAATLESAFCDKLVAFATRPHLKWRDIFDVWWLTSDSRLELPTMERLAPRFIHHLSEYRTAQGLAPSAALEAFAARMGPDVARESERSLKPWLPEHLWQRVYPDHIEAIVASAREYALQMAAAVKAQSLDAKYQPLPMEHVDVSSSAHQLG